MISLKCVKNCSFIKSKMSISPTFKLNSSHFSSSKVSVTSLDNILSQEDRTSGFSTSL